MPALPVTIVDLTAGHAAPGTDTDILEAGDINAKYASGADIQVPDDRHGCLLRIAMTCAAASKVKLVDDTGTEILLNGGSAVVVDAGYVWDWPVSKDRTYNLQLDTTDGIITSLQIQVVVA